MCVGPAPGGSGGRLSLGTTGGQAQQQVAGIGSRTAAGVQAGLAAAVAPPASVLGGQPSSTILAGPEGLGGTQPSRRGTLLGQ